MRLASGFWAKYHNNEMASQTEKPPICIRTPLIESVPLKKYSAGRKVYLKLENCQPSGSCKLRGYGTVVQYAKSHGFAKVVCPSSGNGGLAAAYAATQVQLPCHIVVPGTTPLDVCETIRQFGATVEVYGDNCEDAEHRAEELVAQSGNRYYLLNPAAHELLGPGIATIVDEVAQQLDPTDGIPSLIVTCCGGGQLVAGLVEGVRRAGWQDRTRIVVMETHGAHSFHESVKVGGSAAKLDRITSIAISLACLQVDDTIRKFFVEASPPLLSRVVTDKQAANACVQFANDHRFLVGPSCGATLSAVYEGIVERILMNREAESDKAFDRYHPQFYGNLGNNSDGPVVVIVCGGSEISFDMLTQLRKQFEC